MRVSGLDDKARLFDVVCTTGNISVEPKDSTAEKIRLLRVQKTSLESQKRVLQYEADTLVNYAKTLEAQHVSPGDMTSFLEAFVDKGRKNLVAVADIDEEVLSVEREIDRITSSASKTSGNSNTQVTIVLNADEAASADLKLTYSE